MGNFKPNRQFRARYDRTFEKNPMGANMLLLIAELANGRGHVKTTEEELTALFNARFDDPKVYQLGGPKR